MVTGRTGRRLLSVPGVMLAALLLAVLLPLWLVLGLLADAVRGRLRFPLVRLLAFALWWTWLESLAVMITFGLFLAGRAHNQQLHYALQRWWALNLMRGLRATTGIRVAPIDTTPFRPGPVIVLFRHASLADALLSAWIVTSEAHLRPRYVLKRELLGDPCLDIAGHRLPNHFLDRNAADSGPELAALTALSTGMGLHDAAVIFPEGTRASPAKRERAMQRIGERDPQRAQRLSGLRHLLPPRPAGTAALLAGCPQADVVLAWHTGFDGLDTFGGILRHLARRPPVVQCSAIRVPRADVDAAGDVEQWLDASWIELDRRVDAMISAR